MKKLCIYHGGCADGFGAAMAVKMALGDTVEFYAGVHQHAPPDVKERDVIIVDFSYKRPVLITLAQQAKRILILDHHLSAAKDLVDLPDNVTTVFDMNRSGAVIAWEYFHQKKPIPKLLLHIQDNDLWRFELEGTKEIIASVFSYPHDFTLWERLIHSDLKQLRQDGIAIERKHRKDVNRLIASSAYRMVIAGYDVPVLNAPYFYSSDAGHIMGKNEPFAACYHDNATKRSFSLRSEKEGVDVSKIAVMFGGGGHQHAAGFSLPFEALDTLAVASHNL
jgi:oligoribonuclease NrnB/cAMP/cGMP phosphodiesterase (DHH superfamily)